MNKKTKAGFTLVELLVVVLIIGILAAVAVPQYQRAIDRSHLATYLTLGTQIRNAQNVYFLQNGKYAGNFEDLDLTVKLSNYCQSVHTYNSMAWNCRYGFGLDNHNQGASKHFRLMWCPQYRNTKTNYSNCWDNVSAIINFHYATDNPPNKITCQSFDDRGKKLCQSIQ